MDKQFFCASKGLVFKDGRFLIIKRSLQARGDPFSWELPGGALEFSESPQAALVREVKEETSLDVDCLNPLSVWTFLKNEDIQVIGITFLCALRADGPVRLSREHDEYAWIRRSETGKYRFSKGVMEEMRKWDWTRIENRD